MIDDVTMERRLPLAKPIPRMIPDIFQWAAAFTVAHRSVSGNWFAPIKQILLQFDFSVIKVFDRNIYRTYANLWNIAKTITKYIYIYKFIAVYIYNDNES